MSESQVPAEDKFAAHRAEVAKQRELYADNLLTATSQLVQTIRKYNKGAWTVVQNHPKLMKGAHCFAPTITEIPLSDGKTMHLVDVIIDESNTLLEGRIEITKPKSDGNGVDKIVINRENTTQFFFNELYVDYHTGSPGSNVMTQKIFDAMEVFPESTAALSTEEDKEAESRRPKLRAKIEELMNF